MRFLRLLAQLPLLDKLLGRKQDVVLPGPSRAATSCAPVRKLFEQGRLDEAEQACCSLLHLYPDSLEGLALAFRLALAHGSYRSAIQFLETGVRMRPDTAELSFMLG
ncbi:MAG TPA: tetratricopeptide repeat protein, partial [Burkholderiaceae bacterium]